MLSREQLLLTSVIAFVVFLYSLEMQTFSAYSLLGLFILGIILFFGINQIKKMLQSGKSITAIILVVIVMIIALIFIWGGYMVYINKKQINKNWPQYRCKPYILPFAGWAVGPNGTSPTDNFTNCMWSINKTFFDILISPFTDILKVITGILSSMTSDIQNIRKMITYLRDNMEEIARDALQKIWDAYVRIAFLFKTILRVFKKLGDVYKDLFDVLLYAFYSVASIWNGPIGGVANFFCFDENTIILLEGGILKKIKDIKLGDILEDNNIVKGILNLDANNVKMYNYQGVVVSGNHLVKESKWIRVKNSLNSKIINYDKDKIYCLITQNSLIKIDDIIFSDYIETNNKHNVRKVYKYIIKRLNKSNELDCNKLNNKLDKKIHIKELQSGMKGNIKIKMKTCNYKRLMDIKIGDVTFDGKVLGLVNINTESKYRYQDMVMSGNMIVKYNNKWLPIYKIGRKIKNNDNLYHIITESNMVYVKNSIYDMEDIICRDFEQLDDNQIDKDVLEMLNKVSN